MCYVDCGLRLIHRNIDNTVLSRKKKETALVIGACKVTDTKQLVAFLIALPMTTELMRPMLNGQKSMELTAFDDWGQPYQLKYCSRMFCEMESEKVPSSVLLGGLNLFTTKVFELAMSSPFVEIKLEPMMDN
ncbi:hypothetical protein Ddye_025484 [Dipteronia dyeriana]|uniref:Uncharacterized protein n=1 Tax=Dipteronia dyeriana TaxID=168575 RepID=A0AAD9TKB0_9ROSI|nr:hypothetical protein Ddye_025484 [Dipteronia dyeriana]